MTAPAPVLVPTWSRATLVAFRFCVAYIVMYVFSTQMFAGLIPIPGTELPDLSAIPAVQSLYAWIGHHILGIAGPIELRESGSGDKLFDWVQSASLLLIAAAITIAWSVRDARRPHHARLFAWFRLFLRFALGSTLIGYGMAKVVPLQMPILALARLVEPFGNFSPMGVLWYSVGSSPAYEILTGCAETTAGLLLFAPQTATLGALLALVDMSMVFILNMTYDVPVKLFSLHLVVFSLILIAPNARRLFDLFIAHRPAVLRSEPPLGGTPSRRRGAVIAQLVFGACLIAAAIITAASSWSQYGNAAPRSALFGIWDVTVMSVDGQLLPPLLTDTSRIRRLIFQQPGVFTEQRMDDSFRRITAVVDSTKHTVVITLKDPAKPKAVLSYSRPAPQRLALDGPMDGHTWHMELTERPIDSFLLRNRGFHWVQEAPFNR